jgi:hypothetical protein
VDHYQYLLPKNVNFPDEKSPRGLPLEKKWKTLRVYSPHPLKKAPDFWGLFSSFAVSEETLDRFYFLEEWCEFLPIDFEGVEFWLINVTCVLNCLDKRRSKERKQPYAVDLETYYFHSSRLWASIFKIPETHMTETLCLEGGAARNSEFKNIVEDEKFTGLKFYKVWTNRKKRRKRKAE